MIPMSEDAADTESTNVLMRSVAASGRKQSFVRW